MNPNELRRQLIQPDPTMGRVLRGLVPANPDWTRAFREKYGKLTAADHARMIAKLRTQRNA